MLFREGHPSYGHEVGLAEFGVSGPVIVTLGAHMQVFGLPIRTRLWCR